jgi:hypothetical protein
VLDAVAARAYGPAQIFKDDVIPAKAGTHFTVQRGFAQFLNCDRTKVHGSRPAPG